MSNDSPVPAAREKPRSCERQHMELVRRPLRKGRTAPPSDAAGVTTAQRHGRGKLKGKGNPPPEQQEWTFHPAKQFIDGKSFTSSMSTVIKHDAAREEPSPSARPSLRLYDRSYEANLAGGGVSVLTPPHVPRPMRRVITPGPRTERVLNLGPDAEPPVPTYALLGTARRDVFVTSRPTSAPACVLLSKKQTRVGYESSRDLHADVIQYRHSGGICPPEYKLATERPAAPQVAPPPCQQARNSFLDARSSYQSNKLRSEMSNVITAH